MTSSNKLYHLLEAYRTSHPIKLLQSANHQIEYIKSGSGNQVVLLLPGFASNSDSTFRLVIELERDFRVISPTYPQNFRIDQLIYMLEFLITYENVEKISIIGHSLGASLAICLYYQCAIRIDRLILSSVTILPEPVLALLRILSKILPMIPPGWILFCVSLQLAILRSRLATEDRVFLRMFYEEFLSSQTQNGDLFWQLNYFIRSNEILLHKLQSNHCDNLQPLLICPQHTLIIKGGKSALTRIFPIANFVTIENAGHSIPATHFNFYVKAISNFLHSSGISN